MPNPFAFSARSANLISLMTFASLAAMTVSVSAFANVPITHYVGTAFDQTGHELYTESHWISRNAGETERLILFRCPDGKAFARKRVEDAGHAESPLFELDDSRYGYREGVRIASNGKREVFVRRGTGQTEQTALLESVPRLVVDAGFDRFIATHWNALAAGKKQRVEFLLPSRLRTYSFMLSPRGADQIDGKPVLRFRLELDAWFGFALPSIDMAYSTDTKAIREYTGVSNIRGSDGKNLNVHIEFPPTTLSADVDPQSLAAAEATRLDGRCTL